MLAPVENLRQTAQDSSGTSFAWDPVALADRYSVSLDGAALATVTAPSVKVMAAAVGTHTLAVAPLAGPTPPTKLGFTVPNPVGTRNPLLWPFASTAYPNMPVGSGAVRVAANLIASTIQKYHADVSIILMDPSQPATKILPNGGFKAADRCAPTSSTPLGTVPMAAGFLVPSAGHNYSTAAVNSDGSTYIQGGSFARCVAAQPATMGSFLVSTSTLAGTALGKGGRGGSGMDSLAGTIRVGELAPGAPPIGHAIALDLDDLDNATNTWVWPATKKDSYAYNGSNPHTVPGCLLVLPLDFDIAALKSVPGRMFAQAMHDHGGYNGNDVKGPGIGICTEWSPAGDVQANFQRDWGYAFAGSAGSSPWIDDLVSIFSAVEVVTNNGPTSIGGGGTPIVALAPPLS